MTATPRTGTQCVDRAASLLAEIVHADGPRTFASLSTAAGLSQSTAYRLLLALERNGLVRRDDEGRFVPGEMFVSRTAEAKLASIKALCADAISRYMAGNHGGTGSRHPDDVQVPAAGILAIISGAPQAGAVSAEARLAAVRDYLDRFLGDYGTSGQPAFLVAAELAREVRELAGDGAL